LEHLHPEVNFDNPSHATLGRTLEVFGFCERPPSGKAHWIASVTRAAFGRVSTRITFCHAWMAKIIETASAPRQTL